MLEYLYFALAVLGHTCLLMAAVNFVYAHPLDRTFLKVFRALIGLLIFGGPVLYAWFRGFQVSPNIRSADDLGACFLTFYLLLVLGIGALVFPYLTIRRWFRRRPDVVVRESTQTVDVARQLGQPPYGDGETAALAHLPFNDIFHVEFTTLELALPGVPPTWDGLVLLQLSDMHFLGTPSKAFYEFIVGRCMSDGVPDLLLITGDIVDTDTHHEWIGPILGPLRWKEGAFAILGNHDRWQDYDRVRDCLRSIGMNVVSNTWKQIVVRGEKMTIIGHEGPWFKPGPDLAQCPREGWRILLSHTPDNIRWAQRQHVALMLSGHNHGGQVRVPLVGSIFVPSKFCRRYDMGTFHEPPTCLHVNRGLSGKEPIRFRCRPQITRIILRVPSVATS